jgi:hypothetical protein
MMHLYDVGEFEVMVQGGGPAGILEAVRQRKLGKKVLLIESRSCLIWQVARAKQGDISMEEDSVDPVLASFLNKLEEYKALRGGRLEPSYTEIAADQWLLSEDVSVLFQAKLLRSGAGEALLALKGMKGVVRVKQVIDCRESINSGYRIDSRRYPFSIWTLTLQNVRIDNETYLELDVGGKRVPVRLRHSYHPSDTMADIAYPNDTMDQAPVELLFASAITSIVDAIRSHREEWSKAIMIYMGDEPWIPEQQEQQQLQYLDADPFWSSVTKQFNELFIPARQIGNC